MSNKRRIIVDSDSDSDSPVAPARSSSPDPVDLTAAANSPPPPSLSLAQPRRTSTGSKKRRAALSDFKRAKRLKGRDKWSEQNSSDELLESDSESEASVAGDDGKPKVADIFKRKQKKAEKKKKEKAAEAPFLELESSSDESSSGANDNFIIDDEADDNSGASTSSDDNSDEDGETPKSKRRRYGETVPMRSSSSKKKKQQIRAVEYDADMNSEDDAFIKDGESEDSSGSEEEDRNFSHAAFDLMNGSDDEDAVGFFKASRGMTERESHKVWLDDLVDQVAHYHKHKGKGHQMKRKSSHAALVRKAVGRIEKPLNTHRESTLASSVWTQAVANSIVCRPVLQKYNAPAECSDCQICRREGHAAPFEIMLTGPKYNSQMTGEFDVNWTKALKYEAKDGEEEEVESSSEEEDSEEHEVVSGEREWAARVAAPRGTALRETVLGERGAETALRGTRRSVWRSRLLARSLKHRLPPFSHRLLTPDSPRNSSPSKTWS